ncbi:MAG: bile acid:sodium symporter [Zetaproteobacteria bacterium CG_4_9_14_3_um_filter_49_83]|nr:MAG: bile acid:sodium symporter [Zetaproteobacteria bacterium CG1_02_49_23]PIQ34506.1 MAG: bile acid:sodium symporter [Zetaproteobacteria bacterium CG17_big_fil_post_rev_8_21_14_2_50_50_13]PIV30816.1 MAG: bile acid:sodium symporter [Zetaproteobacteria bacterium CG02_land_8_20_14_3_00_50_9]PJA34507.1 MAG: bile acid:sodium symporter [Zetaproteobacteria bacterium CG_4_9_14_3_um_filter_49_83]
MYWQFLSRNLAILTLVCACMAYLYPPAFLIFKHCFLWFFAATMFALGLVMKPEEAKAALSRPATILIGVVTQFTVMPALGFAAAMISVWQGASSAVALGFIIVGCAPGAMASNVIAYLLGGAVAFSIAMTMLATSLSPLLTPVLVEWLGGVFMEIPFWPMMQTILLSVVLPLIAGMLIHYRFPQYQQHYEHLAPDLAALAIIIICSYAVADNQQRIAETPWVVFALVVALNAGGYLAGWFIAGLCNFDRRYQITLAVEIGMQNAGLGVVLALKHFEPESALPGALFAVWCILTAAGLSRWKKLQEESVSAC